MQKSGGYMISSEHFTRLIKKVVIEVLTENGSDNEILYSNFKQGRVDPNYVSGRPSIIFAGESAPSGKKYPYLSSYTPVADDVVILAEVAGSYIILGKKV